jgi:iron complex outermembrane receptor protein
MKSLQRDALRVASLAFVSTSLISTAALAQNSPSQSAVEEVVVTGSHIRGATEDGPLSVEVFSAADLEAQGAPNIVEFTRNLTSSSEAFGEPNIDFAGTAAGRVTVNLRGLGATRTMVLLNGHRTSDDVSFIPTNALERVEVLQDGAGVTYGAGAVGGVMNFVTKRNFRGLELTAQHKFIEGSDGGAQEGGFAWGFGSERADILIAAQYARQGMLNMTERDYGTLPFSKNREQYVTVSAQPGVYQVPSGPTTFSRVTDFNSTSCGAVGGVYTPSGPFGPTAAECMYYYTPLFNFTDETENIRLFGSVDYEISDTMRGRLELGYSKTEVPETWAAPVIPPDNARRAVGAAGTLGFNFRIPYSVNGIQNPYVQDFYNRNRGGAAAPTTGDMYTGYFWEPFAMNGNPVYEGGARYESREADRWGFSAQLEGELPNFMNGINYSYGVSGGMTRVVLTRRDLITSRLQNALLGYGGPNCTAADQVPTNYTSVATYNATVGIQNSTINPGTNGCEWFNPFASSFAASAVNGQANPAYGGASFQNSLALLKWIQPDMPLETRVFDVNVDVVFSGELPEAIALPGGEISWALGGQYRSVSDRTSSRVDDRELFALQTQPCPWAGQLPNTTGCGLDPPGAFWGTSSFVPSDSTQEVASLFTELRLPIVDSVEAQVALRHEDYGGGFDGTVYKVAAKWQMLDWLALRGSFSTNYAAPPSNITDTTPVPGAAYITRFTTYFPTLTRNLPDTGPEEATVKNIGLLLNADAFTEGSYITASLDYFEFDIKDQIVTSAVTTVLNNIVPTANGNQVTALLNCSAPLLQFVTLSSACVQGTTRLSDVGQFQTFQTNGPGTKTAGVELGLDYFQPLLGGDFSFGVNATRVTKYEVEGYSVNGVVFETGGDRLGFANTSRSGDFSSTLRANSYLGYRIGAQSFRVQANYTHGVRDERFWPITAANSQLYGVYPNNYTDYDFHYRLELPFMDETAVRLSVLNVTDEDPMAAQTRNAYWTGVGSARGRQIEFGVTAKF